MKCLAYRVTFHFYYLLIYHYSSCDVYRKIFNWKKTTKFYNLWATYKIQKKEHLKNVSWKICSITCIQSLKKYHNMFWIQTSLQIYSIRYQNNITNQFIIFFQMNKQQMIFWKTIDFLLLKIFKFVPTIDAKKRDNITNERSLKIFICYQVFHFFRLKEFCW